MFNLNNFIRSRGVAFYVALGVAVVAVIAGIVAVATLSFAGDAWYAIMFSAIGLVLFIALSVSGREKLGAALLACCIFAALIGLICGVYKYFVTEVSNQAMSGTFDVFAVDGISAFIACVAMLVVCAIAANVLAWVRPANKNVA